MEEDGEGGDAPQTVTSTRGKLDQELERFAEKRCASELPLPSRGSRSCSLLFIVLCVYLVLVSMLCALLGRSSCRRRRSARFPFDSPGRVFHCLASPFAIGLACCASNVPFISVISCCSTSVARHEWRPWRRWPSCSRTTTVPPLWTASAFAVIPSSPCLSHRVFVLVPHHCLLRISDVVRLLKSSINSGDETEIVRVPRCRVLLQLVSSSVRVGACL